MDHSETWDSVVARLRAVDSLEVIQYELEAGATEDDIEVIKLMKASMPPKAIMDFFRATNGVKLLWSGSLGGHVAQGAVNIVTLLESALRAPAQEEGEPLEGVLWTDEFPPQLIDKLKRMAIFEAIAGRSDYLTYSLDKTDARLFLVQNDKIRPIIPDFETTIKLLMHYAGAEGLREYLTYEDWPERIRDDDLLSNILELQNGQR
jgi:hypothetical protein